MSSEFTRLKDSNTPNLFSYIVDHFAPSPRMSVHILAFAVLDDFNKARQMTKNTKKPIEVNVFAATPNFQEQSEVRRVVCPVFQRFFRVLRTFLNRFTHEFGHSTE